MTYPDFNPLDWSRLRPILLERIQGLPDELRERALAAEPNSTMAYPPVDGWIRFTVGLADPVEIGWLPLWALRRDMTPHSGN